MEKDRCKTCEHESDSGTEYCGTCGSGVESNWTEARWIKDEKIKALELQLAKAQAIISQDYTAGRMTELEEKYYDMQKIASHKDIALGNLQKEMVELQDKLAKAREGLEKILKVRRGYDRESFQFSEIEVRDISKSTLKEIATKLSTKEE